MAIAEWNSKNQQWEKGCPGCDKVFVSKADKWPEAFVDFSKNFDQASDASRSSDELNSVCKECKNHRNHKRIINGLTRDEMLARQNFMCLICDDTINSRSSRIDHDHYTGIIRGLLCHLCNMRMGAVDDRDWLVKAIQYRDKHRENN